MADIAGGRSGRSRQTVIRRARRSGIRSGGDGRAISDGGQLLAGGLVELTVGDEEVIDPDGVATTPTETT